MAGTGSTGSLGSLISVIDTFGVADIRRKVERRFTGALSLTESEGRS
jgi:hypothetical protein